MSFMVGRAKGIGQRPPRGLERLETFRFDGGQLGLADKPFVAQALRKAAQVTIPANAAGTQIHVILEVRDKNPVVPLFAYRRIVVNVK